VTALLATQEVVEVLSNATPLGRVTQEAVEVLSTTSPAARATQEVVEVLSLRAATGLVVAQETVELLSSNSTAPARLRLAQEVVEVVSRDTAEARLTTLARLVVGVTTAQANTTRLVRMSLSEMVVACRVTRMVRLTLADAVPCLTFWATCWRIRRTDGVVFAFTSHDTPVQFRGENYQPCGSLTASASELGAMLGDIGNMELLGMITDDSITDDDLMAGRFDNAEIEVWLFPWSDAGGETPRRLIAGRMGNLKVALNSYTAEVLTDSQKLQQRSVVQLYTPGCRFELGDSRCTKNMVPLTVSGTVTSVATPQAHSQAERRVFQDSSRSEGSGYFDLGKITWTSGDNAGVSTEVKTWTQTVAAGDIITVLREFRLWEAMLHPIKVGDTYTVAPGCDKTPETCKVKFDNFINFGGFPNVPGGDAIVDHPN
jgi:uncharacterized phage protein (TIGR02218 family)